MTIVSVVISAVFSLTLSVLVMTVTVKVTMSNSVLYRLHVIEDWKRYEEWCLENDCKTHKKMLSCLCDYSIQRLLKYCDLQLNGFNFNHFYYYNLRQLVIDELYNQELDCNILSRENKAIPLAPVKKYSHELWDKHPLELFFDVS